MRAAKCWLAACRQRVLCRSLWVVCVIDCADCAYEGRGVAGLPRGVCSVQCAASYFWANWRFGNGDAWKAAFLDYSWKLLCRGAVCSVDGSPFVRSLLPRRGDFSLNSAEAKQQPETFNFTQYTHTTTRIKAQQQGDTQRSNEPLHGTTSAPLTRF
jgi:hypothetical protein